MNDEIENKEEKESIRKRLIYIALKCDGNWQKIVQAIHSRIYMKDDVSDVYSKINSKVVTCFDKDYPECFKNIYMMPLVLFYHGDLSLLGDQNSCISVVGTRHPNEYGVEITKNIICEMHNEKTIVSGMAEGIDSIAHTQALEMKGKTVAILGSGINYVYPDDNVDLYTLYNNIKEKGLVISEYPNSLVPQPDNFLFRNRLIAAASKCLLVTQAFGPKSGTLNTIRHALDMNKEILLVPDQADLHSVCNQTIQQGGTLVENGEDVLTFGY